VASLDDLDAFFYWYTSPEKAVKAHLKEVRFIPYVEMTFVDELPFVFPRWYTTCNHKINNICVLGVRFCDFEEHVVSQRIIDG
jgi:hypothetical protein